MLRITKSDAFESALQLSINKAGDIKTMSTVFSTYINVKENDIQEKIE